MVIVLPGADKTPKEIFDADTLGRTLERLEPAKVSCNCRASRSSSTPPT